MEHDILDNISCSINNEESDIFTSIPNLKEIREAVFSMSSSSLASLDGYNDTFYHKCWDIIKEDVKNQG